MDVETHRARYRAMGDEPFATLVEDWFNDSSSFTPEAVEAIQLAMQDRETSVVEIAKERVRQAGETRVIAAERQVKTDKRLSREGGWMGIAGLIVTPVIAVPSAMQGHLGGLITAAACGFCSIWLIVRWRQGRV